MNFTRIGDFLIIPEDLTSTTEFYAYIPGDEYYLSRDYMLTRSESLRMKASHEDMVAAVGGFKLRYNSDFTV